MGNGPTAWTIAEHTASDGYRWRYRRYCAQGPPRAELVFIHGIQSHAGWYEHSCTRFAQAGYHVSFLDRRGAGMNEEARGDAPGASDGCSTTSPNSSPRCRAPSRVGIPSSACRCSWGRSPGAASLLRPSSAAIPA